MSEEPKKPTMIEGPDGPRSFFPPHMVIDFDGPNVVHPSVGLEMANMQDEYDHLHPILRMKAMQGHISLCFVPTAHELRQLGRRMIERADEMDSAAAEIAGAALDRIFKKGEGQ